MMTSQEVGVADTANLLHGGSDSPRDRCCRVLRKRSWFYVEPALTAYCFCQFPIMIIIQKYTLDWLLHNVYAANSSHPTHVRSPCDPNITDDQRQLDDKAQSLASLFSLIESAVWGVPAVIVTIVLGAGSDQLGRRFSFLPPLLGTLLSSIVLYSVVHTNASIAFMLIGDFAYGCCGAFTAMTMSCYSYVADRTPAERRMLRITLLQLCFLVAGIVSPISVGPLIDAIGAENVMLIVILIATANFAYVFFFLRNDVDKVVQQSDVLGRPLADSEDRRDLTGSVNRQPVADVNSSGYAISGSGSGDYPNASRLRHGVIHSDNDLVDFSQSLNRDDIRANSETPEPPVEFRIRTLCDSVRHVFLLFLSPGPHRVRLNILMAAFFVAMMPDSNMSVSNLFEMNKPLCWSIKEIGTFTGITLAISTLGAFVVTPAMKKCATDWHIAMTACIAAVITNVYKCFVRNTIMMFLSSSLSMFIVLFIPSIRSIMSALVSDHEQGAVFGAIASVEVLCLVIGAAIFNTIYSETLRIASGLVFLVMAIFYAVSGVIMIVYHIRTTLETRRQQQQQQQSTEAA